MNVRIFLFILKLVIIVLLHFFLLKFLSTSCFDNFFYKYIFLLSNKTDYKKLVSYPLIFLVPKNENISVCIIRSYRSSQGNHKYTHFTQGRDIQARFIDILASAKSILDIPSLGLPN